VNAGWQCPAFWAFRSIFLVKFCTLQRLKEHDEHKNQSILHKTCSDIKVNILSSSSYQSKSSLAPYHAKCHIWWNVTLSQNS
jgi:hypothetical protein